MLNLDMKDVLSVLQACKDYLYCRSHCHCAGNRWSYCVQTS